MKTSSLVLIFSFVSVCFSQQLINLGTIKGGGEQTPLQLPTPFGIYLSACTDSSALLGQIFVVTGNNEKISLNQLKSFVKIGELQPHRITNSAYLTTTLTADQLNTLNGVLFLSTSEQLQDGDFQVYDVSTTQYIAPKDSSTIVFLNTCMDTIPKSSSITKDWYQDENTVVSIYAGIPMDSIEPKNTQIFSNPMHTDKFDEYFQHVEKFSISLNAFYMKSYGGLVYFQIQPASYDMWSTPHTTKDYTTTGFYMKPIGQDDRVITINTTRDTKYSGSTGANIIGHLPNGQKVTVGEYDGADHNELSVPPNDFVVPWSTPNIGEKIQISSTGGKNGYYYVQYFVIKGGLKSSTTASNVETTTSSTGKLKSVITLMISTIIVGFL